jgi:hypothetical protein
MGRYDPPDYKSYSYGKPKDETQVCKDCGRSISEYSQTCPYCGRPVWDPRRDTRYAVVGGAFSIVSGILTILFGAFILTIGSIYIINIPAWEMFCGVVPIVFGLISLLGGICAIQRRAFAIAVIGAVFAFLTTLIFGILALIFIFMGKDEFR